MIALSTPSICLVGGWPRLRLRVPALREVSMSPTQTSSILNPFARYFLTTTNVEKVPLVLCRRRCCSAQGGSATADLHSASQQESHWDPLKTTVKMYPAFMMFFRPISKLQLGTRRCYHLQCSKFSSHRYCWRTRLIVSLWCQQIGILSSTGSEPRLDHNGLCLVIEFFHQNHS